MRSAPDEWTKPGLTPALLSLFEVAEDVGNVRNQGGFDPADVNEAQAAMKVADEVLAKYPTQPRIDPGRGRGIP